MFEKEREEIDETIADKMGYMEGLSKDEKMIHIEAFEYYFSLGGERSYSLVAKKFNKNYRTISQWANRFNWKERIVIRDAEVSKRLSEKTTNAVIDEKANYRKVIKLAMAKLIKELQEEDFKSKGIADLEKLVKLDMLLLGETTEKVELDNKQIIEEKDRQALKELNKNISNFVKV